MNLPDPIPSDLLAAYLAGEADAEQRLAVEAWAAAAPEHTAELERMRTVWDLGSAAVDVPPVSVEAAWNKLEKRWAEAEGMDRVRPLHRRVAWGRWLAAAAALVGLSFALRLFMRPDAEVHLALAEPIEVLLADSSRTVLSPGTKLEELDGPQRANRLQGQAYFEVRRDERRPFTVAAGEVLITVLGTAFEVTAYDTSAFVSVRVRSGRVRVEAGAEHVELGAGDQVRYDKRRHFLERRPAAPAEVWGLRVLQFEGAALPQVVEQLERIYKVRVQLGNTRVAACRLTAEFDNEPIGTILDLIAETFGLQVERNAEGYVLIGDGC